MKPVLPSLLKSACVLLFCVLIANGKAIAQCLTNQLTVNTGYNPATGGPYAVGVQDQYWSITFNSSANQPSAPTTPPYQSYTITPNAAYVTNPGSTWICFIANPNYTTSATTNDSAYYNTYTRHFKNCLADTFTFNLQWAADNWLSSLIVDGVTYFTQGVQSAAAQFNTFHAITPFSVYMTPGIHTIDAIVFNYPSGGINPTGLNIIGTITGTQNSLLKDTCHLATSLTVNPPTDTVCPGGTVPLTATGGLSFTWAPSPTLNTTTGTSVIATPQSTTTYYVTSNICLGTITDSVTITVVPKTPVNAGRDTSTCIHNDINLKAVITAPFGPYTQRWTPSTGLSDSTSATPTVKDPTSTTDYVFAVTYTYHNHTCVSADTMVLTVIPYLTVNAGPDTTVCIHNNFQLDAVVGAAAGTYNVMWSPGTFLSDSTIYNPVMQDATDPITYIVTVIPKGGVSCPTRDTVHLDIIPVFTFDTKDTSICTGQSVRVSGVWNPNLKYSWSPLNGVSDPLSFSTNIQPNATGSYVLTATDNRGCVQRDTVNINLWVNPSVSVQSDVATMTCTHQAVHLTAAGAVRYTWSPGVFCNDSTLSDPIITNMAFPTLFTVTGTDANGCSRSASIPIDVNEIPEVFMPNAFTPNGDNKNDKIHPVIYCDFIMERFNVFNRFGMQVFVTIYPNDGWDGFDHGVPADIGTYFYEIMGHKLTGEHLLLKGDITLIR